MSISNHYCKPSNQVVGDQTFYDIDDVNGWIPCVLKEYDNGDKMFVVCVGQDPSTYEGRRLSFIVREYFFSVNLNIWTFVKTGKYKNSNKMYVDDSEYVNISTGQLVEEPFEDDLNLPIYSEYDQEGNPIGEPIGYNQKLKSGLISEYGFYSEMLGKNYIFPAIMTAIRNRLV